MELLDREDVPEDKRPPNCSLGDLIDLLCEGDLEINIEEVKTIVTLDENRSKLEFELSRMIGQHSSFRLEYDQNYSIYYIRERT